MVGDEKGEDRLRAVSFAAGAAAFLACIERALMVSVFMHWRVWAFLALNLLLLAILFTSKAQAITANQIDGNNGIGAEAEVRRSKKRRPDHSQLVAVAVVVAPIDEAGKSVESGEIEGKLEDYDQLSEEELKQRVEDFIAMFRQHLICDANTATTANANITSRLFN